MQLQVALDQVDLKPALKIAQKVHTHVDIIEAGTPLIKSVGLQSVRALKKRFPKKLIDADMKAADVGDLETMIAARAGANIVHIMGITPLETIEEAVKQAKKHPNLKITVDICGIKELIGLKGLKSRIKKIEKLGAHYLEVHTTISQQRRGLKPFSDVRSIAKMTKLPLAVAGGINEKTVKNLKNIPNLEIIIVGNGITGALDPAKAAQKIKQIINSF
ncbi:MAG: 3-hexulose-6-phosphate synthase [Patescibacteria group bacterium]|nr:orotidine 5'-phosphate decarboxylase [Patescibacteria group bacterium]